MCSALAEEVALLKSLVGREGAANSAWTAMVRNCICSAHAQLALQKGVTSQLILALFQEALASVSAFKSMVRLSQLKVLQLVFLHAVPAPHERFAGLDHRWPGRERVPTR